jgi:hypothetical protein
MESRLPDTICSPGRRTVSFTMHYLDLINYIYLIKNKVKINKLIHFCMISEKGGQNLSIQLNQSFFAFPIDIGDISLLKARRVLYIH